MRRIQGMIVPNWAARPNYVYRKADTALLGGTQIRSGNTESESGKRTRRKWRPNFIKKRLYSRALEKHLDLTLTANALRTIVKSGGIDQYVIGSKPARIKELGVKGWNIRM